MKYLKLLLVLAVLSIGAMLGGSALKTLAADWVVPPGTPPTCPSGSPGCDAPINVGSSWQTKAGSFGLGFTGACDHKDLSRNCVGLDVHGTSFFTGDMGLVGNLVYKPTGSTPAAGQVLTALDTNGTVGWGASSGSMTFSTLTTPTFFTLNKTSYTSISVTTNMSAKAVIGSMFIDQEAGSSYLTPSVGGSICTDVLVAMQDGNNRFVGEWGVNTNNANSKSNAGFVVVPVTNGSFQAKLIHGSNDTCNVSFMPVAFIF